MEKLKYLSQGERVSLEDILKRNDQRQEQIYNFLNKNPKSSVIKFSLNIPGPIKTNKYIKKVFDQGCKELYYRLSKEKIEIKDRIFVDEKTGLEMIALVDHDSKNIKRICIDIEETSNGRIYDFDVEDSSGPVGRENINTLPRKCYLCNKYAVLCRRQGGHDLEEILKYLDGFIGEFDLE